MSLENFETQILILNNTFNSTSKKNVLNFKLPSTLNLNGYSIGLANASFYYSWPNITSAKNNNTFSYTWIDSIDYTVVLPDGMYSINDISGFLQNQMVLNGHYLLDENGSIVNFITLQPNSVYQACTLSIIPVPSVLPTGWTNPASVSLPATDTTPQLNVLSNAFRTVIGFQAGSYPSVPQTNAYAVNSTTIPQISDVITLNLTCNLVNSSYFNSSPSSIYTFSPNNVGFAELITVEPRQIIFFPALNGSFNYIQVSLLDQNNNDVNMLDPTFVCTLYLKRKI